MRLPTGRRYHALATDYDNTLASGGRVAGPTRAALERLIEDIERRTDLAPGQTRALVYAAIEARYTLPE